ncbi:unnamed protein product [marine sediment metagenome]|uniref:Uncharacterized protein n=1 Tax=marine sediment metagenome TaxID=412755 RepID=X1DBL6_9ZZZZ
MGRVIYTISVPEHSVADSKLKAWRDENINISAILCMLIEESEDIVMHNNALKQKILRLKELTNDRRMTVDEWNECFGMW